jgi:ribosomal-protein-alanine N-acetyltransferase
VGSERRGAGYREINEHLSAERGAPGRFKQSITEHSNFETGSMVAVLKPGELIRPMQKADIPWVMAIEQKSYEFPWSDGIFSDCLIVGYHCFVIEWNGEISGYAIMSIAVAECHILNICIREQQRGQGLGRRFIQYLLEYAHSAGALMAYLEVRPSNIIATSLYWSLGFEQIALRKDYYPARRGREDALVLACVLANPAVI